MSDSDSTKSSSSPFLPSRAPSLHHPSPPPPAHHHSSDDDTEEVIQYVTKAKLEKFFKNFKEMPEEEDLLMVKSCSLEKEVLFPGDFYVTRNFFCFAGKLFKKTVLVVLPVRNVVKIEKKKFGLLSNSIRIEAKDGSKMFISSLSKRDAVLDFINIVWKTTLDPAFQQAQSVEEFPPLPLKSAKTKFFSLEGLFEELKEEHTDSPRTSIAPEQPLVENSRRKSMGPEMKSSDSKEMVPHIMVTDDMDDHAVTASESFSKPEKIYRKKLLVDTSVSIQKGSQPPPSPTTENMSPVATNQSRHSVISGVKEKEKTKKKVEAPQPEAAVFHRVHLNDVFHAGPEEIFTALFGPQAKCTPSSHSDILPTPWEEREGIKTRLVTYTETIKVTLKDSEKYRTCKFRQTQQIITEQPDYYTVNAECWSLDPEVNEGLFPVVTYTICGLPSDSSQGRKSKLVISGNLKVTRQPTSPKESLDAYLDTWDLISKDLAAALSKGFPKIEVETPVKETPPATPVVASKPPPHHSNVPLLVVVSICVILVAIIISLLRAPSDGLTPQEKQWLSFIQSSKSKPQAYDPTEITTMFARYQDRAFPSGELEQLGEKVANVAEKLKKLSRGIARPAG